MPDAWAVVDLGFGDAGKGLTVDALVRHTGADVVVRAQGGAQAAHTVVTPDGRRHTFAQLGAGSFVPGVATLLLPGMIVHPTALAVEAEAFRRAGGPPPDVRLHRGCALVTPYDQALNRLRELGRGAARHGSCGVGVGEVAASEAAGEAVVRAGSLADEPRLRAELAVRAERARAQAAGLPRGGAAAPEWAVLERPEVADAWVARVRPLAARLTDDAEVGARLRAARGVVFEGAQGVLLDRALGFPPHLSWTDAGFGPAEAVCAAHLPGARLHRLGVLRAFPTRHGPGPFPTEVPGLGFREANHANAWQGAVRTGHLDAVLGRYALGAIGGVDTLVLTWLDALRHAGFVAVDAYELDGEHVVGLPAPGGHGHQAAVGARLARARPVRGPTLHEEHAVVEAVETALGARVGWVSRGPTAATFAPWPGRGGGGGP